MSNAERHLNQKGTLAKVQEFPGEVDPPEFPGLPEAPSNLVRRFVFETRTDGLKHISRERVPTEMQERLFNAYSCMSTLVHSHSGWVDPITYDFWRTPCDPETLECTLTPDDVQAHYQHYKDVYVGAVPELDFDLHDVYVLAEERILSRQFWRLDYASQADQRESNERYITQLESILGVIGQAIEEEV